VCSKILGKQQALDLMKKDLSIQAVDFLFNLDEK